MKTRRRGTTDTRRRAATGVIAIGSLFALSACGGQPATDVGPSVTQAAATATPTNGTGPTTAQNTLTSAAPAPQDTDAALAAAVEQAKAAVGLVTGTGLSWSPKMCPDAQALGQVTGVNGWVVDEGVVGAQLEDENCDYYWVPLPGGDPQVSGTAGNSRWSVGVAVDPTDDAQRYPWAVDAPALGSGAFINVTDTRCEVWVPAVDVAGDGADSIELVLTTDDAANQHLDCSWVPKLLPLFATQQQ